MVTLKKTHSDPCGCHHDPQFGNLCFGAWTMEGYTSALLLFQPVLLHSKKIKRMERERVGHSYIKPPRMPSDKITQPHAFSHLSYPWKKLAGVRYAQKGECGRI